MISHKIFKKKLYKLMNKKTYITHSFNSKTVIINKSITKIKLKTNTFGQTFTCLTKKNNSDYFVTFFIFGENPVSLS